MATTSDQQIYRLDELTSDHVAQVGGKNASLGEMIGALREKGVRVPEGFATSAHAYRGFVEKNGLAEQIREKLKPYRGGDDSALEEAGKEIRRLFRRGRWPEETEGAIRQAYADLCRRLGGGKADVAVRSSATAEDLPHASFAGQQETYLNVRGGDDLLDACKACFASLFTDRAIAYRREKGFDDLQVALSVGVQRMVRSDKAGSGVMFSIDTDTGFPGTIVINAVYGLGETIVQGEVNPDDYVVFKEFLNDEDLRPLIKKEKGAKEQKMVYAGSGSKKDSTTKTIETSKRERRSYVLEEDEVFTLARWAKIIEEHYEKPMDMEWAKDGRSGELFIVQARPETVHSQKSSGMLKTYSLKEKGDIRIEGVAIGQAIATGTAQVLNSADDQDQFEEGSILVTPQTDPDWVPVMKKAAGIVTDHGGRTSHAAIVSRELGIPAVVGTGDATDELSDGEEITLSCAEGEAGRIYDGILEFEEREVDLGEIPGTRTGILMNIASPAAAMKWWQLPVKGIGLVRMEFLINNVIKIHPLALTRFDDLEDKDAKKQIRALTADYEDRADYFVETLARGIAQIAAPRHPDPVIVRLSDFKTNEYADLIGGAQFEPEEENPMMGFRGASRYYSEHYRDGFALECRALRRVRDEVGFRNVVIMVPFCRTPEEADRVLSTLAENGLVRGEGGLEIYMMSEVPSNVFLAKEFAARFDGFSIGSNDLTQLVLGVDRDSEELRDLFEERDPAVQTAIRHVIDEAHAAGIKVGICGQGPSDKPDFAEFLVRCGIDTMSLNPDSVLRTLELVARLEQDQHAGTA